MHTPHPIALITGASRRLGRSIALALANSGFHLLLHAHSHGLELLTLADALRHSGAHVTCLQADLTSAQGCTQLALEVQSHTPHLTLLVHNASMFVRSPLETLSPELLRQTLALNLEAPLLLTQALLPLLRQGQDPSILFITDVLADAGIRDASHYIASKAGLEGLVRALAVELAPAMRVNAIAPGTVFFPEDYAPEVLNQLVARIPLARPGDPDALAQLVCFLASQAPYITGQILKVDGGRSARL